MKSDKNNKLIKKLYRHFDNIGFCVFTDDNFEILFIHHGMSCVIIDDDFFNLSYEVNCDPTASGIIAYELTEFANKHGMELNIFEPYADVTDKEGNIEQILNGDDALHYHETGEIPPPQKSEQEIIDPQKNMDSILDQISQRGMRSLNKTQKEFLLNYSKDIKQNHKH